MTTAIREAISDFKRVKNEPLLMLTILCIVLATFTFVLWPLIKVVTFPTIDDYMNFFRVQRWYYAGLHSLYMTFISTISCTIIAFIFAYTIVRLDVPFKRLFRFITVLPIVSPPFIIALSYILLFGGQGIITKHLLNIKVDIYGWQGLWLVQTITFFPYAYAVIYGVLRAISTNLEYAAFNLGASPWQVFRDVIFPLCRPGVAGGALVVAINVLADFGNPLLIAGNFYTLPTEAYMQIAGWYNLPTASVLATALLLPAVTIFFLQRYWVGRRSYVTITGKEIDLAFSKTPSLVKWLLFSVCLAVTTVVILVYGVLVIGAFSQAWGYNWALTLKNFRYMLARFVEIYNSLKFAFLSSLLAASFSMVLAYIVQKKQIGINRFLDFLGILPGAIPGLFLGIGFIMAFNEKPLALTGTGLIIVLGLAFWNIPTCYSSSLAGLQQIGNSVEEAALNLGANNFRSFKDIILPLLQVPFLSGFAVSFLRAITNLSVVIFLVSPRTVVGTISILGLVQNGVWGSAAAFTVTLITIAFVVLGIAQLIMKKTGKSLDI
ncbi:ABC transporter permease [Moorella sulfitireducens]|uniref:ABC transporter permease n=1 Tax=Neomoorella sulfitireducens TaxID=2972948 RepID=UPI0021ACCF4B|nr:iron ABC transporter permease [Moorella sulfitireducens]